MKKTLLTIVAIAAGLIAEAQNYNFSLVSNSTYNFSVVAVPDANSTGDADLESFGFTIMLPDGATVDTGNMTINYGMTLFTPVSHFTAAQLDGADPGQDRNATVIATNTGVGTIPAHNSGDQIVLATFDVLGSPTSGEVRILDNAHPLNGAAGGALSSYIQIDPDNSGSVSNRYAGQTGTVNYDFTVLSTGDVSVDLSKATLFPNPSSSSFAVRGLESEASIAIFGLSGKQVMSIENYKGENVNTSSLSSGMYLVSIEVNGTKEVKRLMVK